MDCEGRNAFYPGSEFAHELWRGERVVGDCGEGGDKEVWLDGVEGEGLDRRAFCAGEGGLGLVAGDLVDQDCFSTGSYTGVSLERGLGSSLGRRTLRSDGGKVISSSMPREILNCVGSLDDKSDLVILPF
jgi:hypothetical protein